MFWIFFSRKETRFFLISTILPGRDPAKAEGQPGVFFFPESEGVNHPGFSMFSLMEDGISSGFCWDEHGQTLVVLEPLEFGVCVGWVFLTGAFNELFKWLIFQPWLISGR